MEVVKRGVLGAVDVWNFVPDSIEVCIRGDGWLVYLDAHYAPRMAMEMEHVHRDGMTCGKIDHAGTVVLVATAGNTPTTGHPATGHPATAHPATVTLPVVEAIPLFDCQIKLVETLFLRATPGGEIIGLVWLNSEVPAFEINGYWYRIEFEGEIGYISRYHREVLQGGCG